MWVQLILGLVPHLSDQFAIIGLLSYEEIDLFTAMYTLFYKYSYKVRAHCQ